MCPYPRAAPRQRVTRSSERGVRGRRSRGVLRALFELWITQCAFDFDPDRNLIPIVARIPADWIETLVRKLGGNSDAAMFGSEDC